MNLLAMLPGLISGNMNVDELCKQAGMKKRLLKENELEGAMLSLCEAAMTTPEVYELTGVIDGAKLQCVIVKK